MNIFVVGAMLILLCGTGCDRSKSSVQDESNALSATETFPIPKPTPPDKALVDRVLEGLPNTVETGRSQRRGQAQTYLLSGKYSRLEAMEEEFHSWPNGELFEDHLEDFYVACLKVHRDSIESWIAESSESHAAHILGARLEIAQIYQTLGKVAPTQASPEQLEAIKPLLKATEGHLNKGRLESCPAYHATRIEYASLSGASRDDIESMLQESDESCPGYVSSYSRAAVHRLRGWPGFDREHEWYQIADNFPAPRGVEKGPWAQARLAVLLHHAWDLDLGGASKRRACPPLTSKPSFEAARLMWPKSQDLLNRYANVAASVNDIPAVEESLSALGNRWSLSYWNQYPDYAKFVTNLPPNDEADELNEPVGLLAHIPLSEEVRSRNLGLEVESLFLQAHFPELEELHSRVLAEKKTTPSGSEHRDYFWQNLSPSGNNNSKNWDLVFDLCHAWQTNYPDSIAAKISEAGLWRTYAWEARGTDWASTVSEEGFRLFRERSKRAVEIYEEVIEQVDDPIIKAYAAGCYLSTSSDKKRGFELLRLALEQEPLNQNVIGTTTTYLLPRWGGKPGELGEFMETINQLSQTNLGPALVARTCVHFDEKDLFKTEVTWEKAKLSFEELVETSNTPRNKFRFARAAHLAGDRATTNRLLQEIGDDWEPDLVYNNRTRYAEMRSWARGG